MSILDYSNPTIANEKWNRYKDKNAGELYLSSRPTKKYMIVSPITKKIVHFGQMGYSDYTKTNDEQKRMLYLKRASKIKGNWKKDKYSPNNLSINILW